MKKVWVLNWFYSGENDQWTLDQTIVRSSKELCLQEMFKLAYQVHQESEEPKLSFDEFVSRIDNFWDEEGWWNKYEIKEVDFE
jgi:hypothetical protein